MNRARCALIVTLAAASALGLPAAAATPPLPAQVTVTQTADSLQAGTLNTVTAVVRDDAGTLVPDGTLVSFSPTGDVVVPDVVGMAPHGANGYWLVDTTGTVYPYGSASLHGDLSEVDLTGSVVGMAATASGGGYWLATDDGKVYPFGDAGSTVIDTGVGGADPVVGIASGVGGIWVATTGGSVRPVGASALAPFGGGFPVAGIVATTTGKGYWLFSTGGAVAAFGDAPFKGDMHAVKLNKPIAGMIPYADGYLLVGIDGGIFNFSNRDFAGSLGANPPDRPVSGIIPTPNEPGYWMFTDNGRVFGFGNALPAGSRWQMPTRDGAASFPFTSASAGQTTITATITGAFGPSAVASQTWTAPPPDPADGPHQDGSAKPVVVRRSGYWAVTADGQVYNFGDAAHLGNATAGAVDLEPTPTGKGYWILNRAGEIQTFGDAIHHGNVRPARLGNGETAASLSATPSGNGYWVFTSRGRAIPFGDAPLLGDVSDVKLNGPVLGSVATPTGKGYYMVASDGGIFTFGDAAFLGSMGGTKLNAPVQSLVPDSDGKGYWLVASDGGIFAFDAPFKGSLGDVKLNKPVVGMVRYGDGYLMVGADGGIFTFSSMPFAGSLGNKPPASAVVAVGALPA